MSDPFNESMVFATFVTPPSVVPEPSSLSLCGVASLAGLGAWARRRRAVIAA